jgi:hypothetical protein
VTGPPPGSASRGDPAAAFAFAGTADGPDLASVFVDAATITGSTNHRLLDVLEVDGQTVRATRPPEDLVFLEA